MRRIITIVAVVTLMATVGILSSGAEEGQKLYTAYNIWKTSRMMCINFKQGSDLIPAGTQVKDVHIWQPGNESYLRFNTVKDGREYTIGFFESVNGMSKRAVLICYGPPPEHYTPNQDANTWYYWMNRRDKITLSFNEDNRLVKGGNESISGINKKHDIETKLKKLRDLRDKDLITQEEYDKKKAKLLEEL